MSSTFWVSTFWGPKFAALGLILLLAALGAGTYLAYAGVVDDAIDPPVEVTVRSPRAGLVMQPGSLVKMHGVEVGTVTGIRQSSGASLVDIRIAADASASIPSNVGADIAATTVFGAKYVTLTDPETAAAETISNGDTIESSSVTVEANSIFETLTKVLDVVQPDKLNSTLTAVATALRGHGADIGTSIDDANSFLVQIEPSIPALQHDITAGATTAETLADATPDLMATLGNVSTTADTITEQKDELDPLLLSVIGMSDPGTSVIGDNAAAIENSIRLARPTTDLLGEYAPVLTCFLQGADVARVGADKVSGANGKSMLLNSTILFGVAPYTYEHDLPVVGATGGPRCGALPNVTLADVPTPFVVANTGTNPFGAGRPEAGRDVAGRPEAGRDVTGRPEAGRDVTGNTSPVLSPTSIIDFLPGGLAAPNGGAR